MSLFIPSKKFGEDADQQLSFPVLCSFWALIDTTDTFRRSNKTECMVLGSTVSVSIIAFTTTLKYLAVKFTQVMDIFDQYSVLVTAIIIAMELDSHILN